MLPIEQEQLDLRMAKVCAHLQISNKDEEMLIGDKLDALLGKPRRFDNESPYLYYSNLDGEYSGCGITYCMNLRGYSDLWAHDEGSRGLLLGVAFLADSVHLMKDEAAR